MNTLFCKCYCNIVMVLCSCSQSFVFFLEQRFLFCFFIFIFSGFGSVHSFGWSSCVFLPLLVSFSEFVFCCCVKSPSGMFVGFVISCFTLVTLVMCILWGFSIYFPYFALSFMTSFSFVLLLSQFPLCLSFVESCQHSHTSQSYQLSLVFPQ